MSYIKLGFMDFKNPTHHNNCSKLNFSCIVLGVFFPLPVYYFFFVNVVFDPVGVDNMAAGLHLFSRMTLHPIRGLDPSLALLPQFLFIADTDRAPVLTGCMEGLTHLVINLTTNIMQVDHILKGKTHERELM